MSLNANEVSILAINVETFLDNPIVNHRNHQLVAIFLKFLTIKLYSIKVLQLMRIS